MSVVNVGSTTSVHRLGKYLEGKDGERVAAYSGLDLDRFVHLGHQIAQESGRQVEAYTVVQSFPKIEFDAENPGDVEKANRLGVETARRIYGKKALFVVVTHVDGSGGCVHNHIVVLNYDPETDLSMRKGRNFPQVKTGNDEIMREHGLSVCEHKPRQGSWELAREQWREDETQRIIGDMVAQAKEQATSYDDFLAQLEAVGMEPPKAWEKKGHKGLTYRARVNGRIRRAASNTLCDEFQPDQLQLYFAQIQHQNTLDDDEEEEEFPQLISVFGDDNYNDESTTKLQEIYYASPDVPDVTKSYKNGNDFELSL